MLHGVRIMVADDEGRLVGLVPIWFIGIGITSGFFFFASVFFMVACYFWKVYIDLMPSAGLTMVVSFGVYLWYNEVMDVLPDPFGRIMYPAIRML